MSDELNKKSCYYVRATGEDCSKWNENQVNEQLGFCEGCDRYYQCNNATILNDKLAEIDNEN